jgi:glycosyltransferase involved in cell wall biosynthesis
MPAPLVSCILPFANAQRITLVRKVVNNFIRQHYTPYELIIVNSSGTKVLTNNDMDTPEMRDAGCRITEIVASSGLNASTMKNIGLKNAIGDWVTCIDDDDYYHPTRLMFQMAHRREHNPCMLKYQLRVDLSEALSSTLESDLQAVQPKLHLLKREDGIPCTMLFPRIEISTGHNWIFDERLNTGEYGELLTRMHRRGRNGVVCDNMHSPLITGLHWPMLSIAVYHGGNELTREQFFPQSDPLVGQFGVPTGLNPTDMEQLKIVLQSYNFQIL